MTTIDTSPAGAETPPQSADLAVEAEQTGPRAAGWWGMLAVIICQAVIFASLIAGYLYLRFNSPAWPPDNLPRPELLFPIIMTTLLVLSSASMQLAQASIARGSSGAMWIFLVVGLLLAVAFLGLLGYDYARSGLTPATDAYGSIFFAITGLLGLHVLVAALMALYLLVRTGLGHFTARRRLAVQNVVMFWHFVVLVWLVIFIVLYLTV